MGTLCSYQSVWAMQAPMSNRCKQHSKNFFAPHMDMLVLLSHNDGAF